MIPRLSPMLAPRLRSIDLFWRAANYLTVGMLYLRANPLLRDDLKFHHVKSRIRGHWGACPALSAIYAHVSDLSRRTGRRMRLVVGTGHAAPAILASLYLEGTLERIYPQLTRDLVGLTALFTSFASSDGFSTETGPEYPGTIYPGGELGGALAFAQGYAFSNANSFCVCVVGDGELETSLTQAAWQGFRFLSSADGRVLPVINANGYKMGSQSLYALQSHQEHVSQFAGYGLLPLFVGPDHRDIVNAFDTAYKELTASDRVCQPVIILETPKGWSGPAAFGDRPFLGTCDAHKPILTRTSVDDREREWLSSWLMSYRPRELFDVSGAPLSEVTECLPPPEHLLGMGHQIYMRKASSTQDSGGDSKHPIEAVAETLIRRIRQCNDILIFSPDELLSNRLGGLLGATRLKYGTSPSSIYASDGRVVEILNEHLCYAWCQGASAAGQRTVFLSYEAFAAIVDSMVAQHLKFLGGCENAAWRPATPAVNIILTSLGWHNTPTHHNPGFVDNLVGRKLRQVMIYMPVTAAATKRFLNEMLESDNRLNIMVINKRPLTRLSSLGLEIERQSGTSWRQLVSDTEGPARVSLVAVGDCMAEEALHAKDIINQRRPALQVRVVAVERVNCLEDAQDPDREALLSSIRGSSSRVFAYNGYPSTLQGVLWELGLNANTSVLGYRDADRTVSGPERFAANRASRFDIANEALRLLS